jgi:hypothetical protein
MRGPCARASRWQSVFVSLLFVLFAFRAAAMSAREYVVLLDDTSPALISAEAATELACRYDATLKQRWGGVVPGLVLEMRPQDAKRLEGEAGVTVVEENVALRISASEDVAEPGNTLRDGRGGWALARISNRVYPADDDPETPEHYNYFSTGSGVRAYVLDTGVRQSHVEFRDAAGVSRVEDGYDVFAGENWRNSRLDTEPCTGVGDQDSCPAGECLAGGHGTAVAALIAGRTYGVAKDAHVVPVRVQPCGGQTQSANIVAGLSWAAQDYIDRPPAKGAVLNMSFEEAFTNIRDAQRSIQVAVSHATKLGIVVVSAGGNHAGNSCQSQPGFLAQGNYSDSGAHGITVGGIDDRSQPWTCEGSGTQWVFPDDCYQPGSSHGRCIDLFAPAEWIKTAGIVPMNVPQGQPAENADTAERRASRSGTSFAAPLVAGAAARLLSEDDTLRAVPAETTRLVFERLRDSATPLTFPPGSVYVDSPPRALYIGAATIVDQPQSTVLGSGSSLRVTALQRGPDWVTTYTWYRGDYRSTNSVGVGQTLMPTSAGDYWVRVTQTSGSHTISADSAIATVSCASAPQITLQPADGPLEDGSTELSVGATGNPTYQWYEGPVANGVAIHGATDSHYTVSGVSASRAEYSVAVSSGGCTIASRTAVVTQCKPAELQKQPAFSGLLMAGNSAVLKVDAEGTGLTFQWYEGESGVVTRPVAGATNFQFTARPRFTSKYWVRVTSLCRPPADSESVEVRVCNQPETRIRRRFEAQDVPANVFVAPGGSLALFAYDAVPRTVEPPTAFTWQIRFVPVAAGPVYVVSESEITDPLLVRVEGQSGSSQCVSGAATTVNKSPCTATPLISNASTLGERVITAGTSTDLIVDFNPLGLTDVTVEWRDTRLGELAPPLAPSEQTATRSRLAVGRSGTFWVRVKGKCPATGELVVDDRGPFTVRCTDCPSRVRTVRQGCIRIGTSSNCTGSIRRLRTDPPLTLSAPVIDTRFQYLWWNGAAYVDHLDTDPNIGTAATLFSVAPAETTTHWVRTIDTVNDTFSDSYALTIQIADPQEGPSVTIAAEPPSRIVEAGTAVRLAAQATGLSGTLRYAWHEVGNDPSWTIGREQTLVIPRLLGDSAFFVDVTGTNAAGQEVTVTSDVEYFAVKCSFTPNVAISVQPSFGLLRRIDAAWLTAFSQDAIVQYKWYRGPIGDYETSIPMAYGQTLNASQTTDTNYWVEATDACGQIARAEATVRVCVPMITTQPVEHQWIAPDGAADLTVAATPAQAGQQLTYRWVRLAGSVVVQNTTSNTLHVTPEGSGTYSVSVECACGGDQTASVPSSYATVAVCALPVIYGQTDIQTVRNGSMATLRVTASGEALSYRWYRGPAGNPGASVFLDETTMPQYGVTPSEDTHYWVRVLSHGVCQKDSGALLVKVCNDPQITLQPVSTEIVPGTSTTLTVAATGRDLRIEWYDAETGAGPLGTGEQFTTPALTAAASYKARVWSDNTCSIDSDPAVVSVCDIPVVIWNPVPTTEVKYGHSQTLAVNMTPEASYTWYRRPAGSSGAGEVIGTGVYWRDVYTTEDTEYWVRVERGVCSSESGRVTVRVCVPEILTQPQAPAGAVNPNTQVTLGVTARGGALKYQWFKGAKGVTTEPVTALGTTSTYTFNPTATGTYWVRVTNQACNRTIDSDAVTVNVCTPLNIAGTNQPLIERGQGVALSVSVYGTNPMTYQWYLGAVGDTQTLVGTGTPYTLPTPPQSTTDYWVRVTDACGNVKDAANKVTVRPVIETHPQSRSLTSNTSTTLTVTVSGAQLNYQWYQGAAGVTTQQVGTNSPSFTTPALTADTSYWVRVFSGAASADSNVATLTICPGPAVQVTNSQVSGSPVELRVNGSQVDMSYTWYAGNPGNTSTAAGSGALITVYPKQDTTYWVRQTNGTCSGDSAAILVAICKPAITTQPQGGSINPNGSHTMTVAATGNPTLQYQWYVSGGAAIAGATAPSYTATPSATTSYYCRVTNGTGAAATCVVNSATVTVTVCQPPAITQQPAPPPPMNPGTVTALRVTATGSNLTYQWYQGTSGDTSHPVFGNTSNPSFTAYDTQFYWVRITNACGAVSSDQVRVSVNPTITAHPQSVQITRGTSATFTVAGSGTGLSYLWYLGTPGGNATQIAGATSPTYTTPPLTADTTYFAVVVSGAAYTVSQTATASVCASPVLSVSNPTQTSGAAVTLSVANPVGGETYRWYRGASGNTSVLVADTGAAGQVSVLVSETSSYWVRATRATCYADSAAETVVICYPKITSQPAGASINEGSSATLSVTATGTAPLTYQWYTGAAGNTASPIAGATGSLLTVTPAVTTSYWAQVKGSCPVNSTAATVTVCNIPKITTQPVACAGMAGYGCALSVTASGSNLSYQWYAGASGDMSRPVTGRTASSMTLANSATEYYWVRVSNNCGSVNSNSVPLSIKPVIWTQPASVALSSGSTATFSVTIQGGTYLSYQWIRSDGIAVGTNSPVFVTPGLTAAYSYYCIITSGTAQTYSNWATVEFCDGPPVYSVSKSGSGSCRYLQVDAQDYYNAYGYVWYRGARGDTSNPVGSTASLQVCPTSSTTYWARVTNGETGCYTDSQTVTVP